MLVYLGADHRGFSLKESIKQFALTTHIAIQDFGAFAFDKNDDYVDFAQKVGVAVSKENANRGIVICGSGVGVEVVANKVRGIRCGLGFSEEQVRSARADDDINILALAADYTDPETAKDLIQIFLETPFSGADRHKRRIEKIKNIEQE